MLTVSGLKNFYFLPHFHDMRCGYAKGYRLMKIRVEEDKSVYRVDWKDIVSILESPVVKEVRLKEKE